MKKSVWILTGAAIVIILLALGTWYFFFRSEKCLDMDCFNEHLSECSRASYLNSGEWTYQYKIKGIKDENCVVDVELLFAGLESKFDSLIDESMRCSIPFNEENLPGSNLAYCTGPLKEKMQYLVIKDLYQYATQNLGQKND